MSREVLPCDGCSADCIHGGTLVLVLDPNAGVKTVRAVRVVCGPACEANAQSSGPTGPTEVFSLGAIGDVYDYAEALIRARDWERGTIQRLTRVLGQLVRQKSPDDR